VNGEPYVELCTSECRSSVQSNLLNADKILPCGKILGDSEGNTGKVCRGECNRRAPISDSSHLIKLLDGWPSNGEDTCLVDFEPDSTVSSKGGHVARSFSHVHVHHSRVIDGIIRHDSQL